jgi:hypothetical protein
MAGIFTPLYQCEESSHIHESCVQELVGEQVTEVLPALENLFLDEFGGHRSISRRARAFQSPLAIHRRR